MVKFLFWGLFLGSILCSVMNFNREKLCLYKPNQDKPVQMIE